MKPSCVAIGRYGKQESRARGDSEHVNGVVEDDGRYDIVGVDACSRVRGDGIRDASGRARTTFPSVSRGEVVQRLIVENE